MNELAMVDQEIIQPSLLPVSFSSVADPFHHLVVVYHWAVEEREEDQKSSLRTDL